MKQQPLNKRLKLSVLPMNHDGNRRASGSYTRNQALDKLIKIYGERNTNTNYINRIISLNLDAKQIPGLAPPYVMALQKILPGEELLRDLYFSFSYQYNLGWKHMCAKPADELNNHAALKGDLCLITLTKNPYSWLISLHRRHYHQYYPGKLDFETFLQTPWKTLGRENCKKILKSPIELWNIKNASYVQLASLNALNLTTESILKSPKSVIEQISTHFSINKISDRFVNHDQSTKEQGKHFSFYRNYYVHEKWREKLSTEAISIINGEVDRKLMDCFDYAVLP